MIYKNNIKKLVLVLPAGEGKDREPTTKSTFRSASGIVTVEGLLLNGYSKEFILG